MKKAETARFLLNLVLNIAMIIPWIIYVLMFDRVVNPLTWMILCSVLPAFLIIKINRRYCERNENSSFVFWWMIMTAIAVLGYIIQTEIALKLLGWTEDKTDMLKIAFPFVAQVVIITVNSIIYQVKRTKTKCIEV